MFDAETARVLREAPNIPGLNSGRLPEMLTRHYAELVSERLRGNVIDNESSPIKWSLDRIADSYEVIASIHEDQGARKAAAFVSATAQSIIARRQRWRQTTPLLIGVTRDCVDPMVSAVLLFLTAEQFADAGEAALEIEVENSTGIPAQLAWYVKSLGLGRIQEIVQFQENLADSENGSLEDRAFESLLRELIVAIRTLAKIILSNESNEVESSCFQSFDRVMKLSINFGAKIDGIEEVGLYPGPRHLASLLKGACASILRSALSKIPPPLGADPIIWQRWIQERSRHQPYVWPNHREFIEKGFHQSGVSAVLVLPTGAGKTTVSSLKIASCLASGRRAIFLAPTHALVDQLVEDLQEIFPINIMGAEVSADTDFESDDISLPKIEVMTPERCLASLSFASERFQDVGLLVFDECHLLAPAAGSFRRSLDGMLCVMAFQKIVPSADFLFMSAMLVNGSDFSRWVEWLTGRKCLYVSLLWKPSRQARGVVVYDSADFYLSLEGVAEII